MPGNTKSASWTECTDVDPGIKNVNKITHIRRSDIKRRITIEQSSSSLKIPEGHKSRRTQHAGEFIEGKSIVPKLQPRSSKLQIPNQMSTIVEENVCNYMHIRDEERAASSTLRLVHRTETSQTNSDISTTMNSSDPSATSYDVDSLTFCSSRNMSRLLSTNINYSASSVDIGEMESLTRRKKLSNRTTIEDMTEISKRSRSNEDIYKQDFSVYPVQITNKTADNQLDQDSEKSFRVKKPSVISMIISDIFSDEKVQKRKSRKDSKLNRNIQSKEVKKESRNKSLHVIDENLETDANVKETQTHKKDKHRKSKEFLANVECQEITDAMIKQKTHKKHHDDKYKTHKDKKTKYESKGDIAIENNAEDVGRKLGHIKEDKVLKIKQSKKFRSIHADVTQKKAVESSENVKEIKSKSESTDSSKNKSLLKLKQSLRHLTQYSKNKLDIKKHRRRHKTAMESRTDKMKTGEVRKISYMQNILGLSIVSKEELSKCDYSNRSKPTITLSDLGSLEIPPFKTKSKNKRSKKRAKKQSSTTINEEKHSETLIDGKAENNIVLQNSNKTNVDYNVSNAVANSLNRSINQYPSFIYADVLHAGNYIDDNKYSIESIQMILENANENTTKSIFGSFNDLHRRISNSSPPGAVPPWKSTFDLCQYREWNATFSSEYMDTSSKSVLLYTEGELNKLLPKQATKSLDGNSYTSHIQDIVDSIYVNPRLHHYPSFIIDPYCCLSFNKSRTKMNKNKAVNTDITWTTEMKIHKVSSRSIQKAKTKIPMCVSRRIALNHRSSSLRCRLSCGRFRKVYRIKSANALHHSNTHTSKRNIDTLKKSRIPVYVKGDKTSGFNVSAKSSLCSGISCTQSERKQKTRIPLKMPERNVNVKPTEQTLERQASVVAKNVVYNLSIEHTNQAEESVFKKEPVAKLVPNKVALVREKYHQEGNVVKSDIDKRIENSISISKHILNSEEENTEVPCDESEHKIQAKPSKAKCKKKEKPRWLSNLFSKSSYEPRRWSRTELLSIECNENKKNALRMCIEEREKIKNAAETQQIPPENVSNDYTKKQHFQVDQFSSENQMNAFKPNHETQSSSRAESNSTLLLMHLSEDTAIVDGKRELIRKQSSISVISIKDTKVMSRGKSEISIQLPVRNKANRKPLKSRLPLRVNSNMNRLQYENKHMFPIEIDMNRLRRNDDNGVKKTRSYQVANNSHPNGQNLTKFISLFYYNTEDNVCSTNIQASIRYVYYTDEKNYLPKTFLNRKVLKITLQMTIFYYVLSIYCDENNNITIRRNHAKFIHSGDSSNFKCSRFFNRQPAMIISWFHVKRDKNSKKPKKGTIDEPVPGNQEDEMSLIYTPIARNAFGMSYFIFKSVLRKYVEDSEYLKMLTPCIKGRMQKAPKTEYTAPPEPVLKVVPSQKCSEEEFFTRLEPGTEEEEVAEEEEESKFSEAKREYKILTRRLEYIFEILTKKTTGDDFCDCNDPCKCSDSDIRITLKLPDQDVILISCDQEEYKLEIPNPSQISMVCDCSTCYDKSCTCECIKRQIMNNLERNLKADSLFVQLMRQVLRGEGQTLELPYGNHPDLKKQFIKDVMDCVVADNRLDANKIRKLEKKYRHACMGKEYNLDMTSFTSLLSIKTDFDEGMAKIPEGGSKRCRCGLNKGQSMCECREKPTKRFCTSNKSEQLINVEELNTAESTNFNKGYITPTASCVDKRVFNPPLLCDLANRILKRTPGIRNALSGSSYQKKHKRRKSEESCKCQYDAGKYSATLLRKSSSETTTTQSVKGKKKPVKRWYTLSSSCKSNLPSGGSNKSKKNKIVCKNFTPRQRKTHMIYECTKCTKSTSYNNPNKDCGEQCDMEGWVCSKAVSNKNNQTSTSVFLQHVACSPFNFMRTEERGTDVFMFSNVQEIGVNVAIQSFEEDAPILDNKCHKCKRKPVIVGDVPSNGLKSIIVNNDFDKTDVFVDLKVPHPILKECGVQCKNSLECTKYKKLLYDAESAFGAESVKEYKKEPISNATPDISNESVHKPPNKESSHADSKSRLQAPNVRGQDKVDLEISHTSKDPNISENSSKAPMKKTQGSNTTSTNKMPNELPDKENLEKLQASKGPIISETSSKVPSKKSQGSNTTSVKIVPNEGTKKVDLEISHTSKDPNMPSSKILVIKSQESDTTLLGNIAVNRTDSDKSMYKGGSKFPDPAVDEYMHSKKYLEGVQKKISKSTNTSKSKRNVSLQELPLLMEKSTSISNEELEMESADLNDGDRVSTKSHFLYADAAANTEMIEEGEPKKKHVYVSVPSDHSLCKQVKQKIESSHYYMKFMKNFSHKSVNTERNSISKSLPTQEAANENATTQVSAQSLLPKKSAFKSDSEKFSERLLTTTEYDDVNSKSIKKSLVFDPVQPTSFCNLLDCRYGPPIPPRTTSIETQNKAVGSSSRYVSVMNDLLKNLIYKKSQSLPNIKQSKSSKVKGIERNIAKENLTTSKQLKKFKYMNGYPFDENLRNTLPLLPKSKASHCITTKRSQSTCVLSEKLLSVIDYAKYSLKSITRSEKMPASSKSVTCIYSRCVGKRETSCRYKKCDPNRKCMKQKQISQKEHISDDYRYIYHDVFAVTGVYPEAQSLPQQSNDGRSSRSEKHRTRREFDRNTNEKDDDDVLHKKRLCPNDVELCRLKQGNSRKSVRRKKSAVTFNNVNIIPEKLAKEKDRSKSQESLKKKFLYLDKEYKNEKHRALLNIFMKDLFKSNKELLGHMSGIDRLLSMLQENVDYDKDSKDVAHLPSNVTVNMQTNSEIKKLSTIMEQTEHDPDKDEENFRILVRNDMKELLQLYKKYRAINNPIECTSTSSLQKGPIKFINDNEPSVSISPASSIQKLAMFAQSPTDHTMTVKGEPKATSHHNQEPNRMDSSDVQNLRKLAQNIIALTGVDVSTKPSDKTDSAKTPFFRRMRNGIVKFYRKFVKSPSLSCHVVQDESESENLKSQNRRKMESDPPQSVKLKSKISQMRNVKVLPFKSHCKSDPKLRNSQRTLNSDIPSLQSFEAAQHASKPKKSVPSASVQKEKMEPLDAYIKRMSINNKEVMEFLVEESYQKDKKEVVPRKDSFREIYKRKPKGNKPITKAHDLNREKSTSISDKREAVNTARKQHKYGNDPKRHKRSTLKSTPSAESYELNEITYSSEHNNKPYKDIDYDEEIRLQKFREVLKLEKEITKKLQREISPNAIDLKRISSNNSGHSKCYKICMPSEFYDHQIEDEKVPTRDTIRHVNNNSSADSFLDYGIEESSHSLPSSPRSTKSDTTVSDKCDTCGLFLRHSVPSSGSAFIKYSSSNITFPYDRLNIDYDLKTNNQSKTNVCEKDCSCMLDEDGNMVDGMSLSDLILIANEKRLLGIPHEDAMPSCSGFAPLNQIYIPSCSISSKFGKEYVDDNINSSYGIPNKNHACNTSQLRFSKHYNDLESFEEDDSIIIGNDIWLVNNDSKHKYRRSNSKAESKRKQRMQNYTIFGCPNNDDYKVSKHKHSTYSRIFPGTSCDNIPSNSYFFPDSASTQYVDYDQSFYGNNSHHQTMVQTNIRKKPRITQNSSKASNFCTQYSAGEGTSYCNSIPASQYVKHRTPYFKYVSNRLGFKNDDSDEFNINGGKFSPFLDSCENEENSHENPSLTSRETYNGKLDVRYCIVPSGNIMEQGFR